MASKSFSNVKIKVSHLDLSKDASRSTLVSGENISHSLGKIARWYKDISWSGHKHTKADITDFAHTHTSLDTSIDVGSEYQPVYFLKGVPTALQYTIKTSVPANAVFTDTNTKVTSVGNHYTPSGGTTTSASGGTLTDITNSANGVQVVTGVTKDAAGHVTGVTSIALKSVNSNTVYAGGTGINIDANNAINHSNSITAITTAAFKKFKYDAQGHITGTANVTASDIPSHSHTVANITDFPVVITGGSQTSSSSSDGGSNIYTFTKSDGTSSTLTVKNGSKGSQGIQGIRGNGIYPITTAPESFTTTTGGFTPVYRATLSTVLSESKATEIKAGDQLRYSYYLYPVGYVDSTYVYLGARTSIRGSTGAGGAAATITVGTVTTGAAGSSASVTNSGTTAAAILDFVIPKGADGKNGTNGTNGTSATWFTGTVVTGTSTTATTFTVSGSKAGDMYLNTSTSNVYRASAANSWIYVCNIKGTAGTTPTLPTFSAEAGTNIGSVGTPSVSYNNGKFTFNYLKGAKGDKGDPGTNATTTAVVSTSANGLAPKVTDTNKFLKGDGTWATPYTHPSYTSKTSGLYKITVDATGHISAATAVAKADIPALDYLSKSGGDVTGSINLKSSTIDGSLENNGVTAKTYPTTFSVFDKSSRILVRTEAVIDNNGSLGWYSYIRNYKTDGTQVAQKGIKFTMDKTGALTWTVDDSSNFRSAISAAASSHTHAVGDVTGGTNKQFLMSNGTKGEWHTLAKADIPALDYVPNTHATTTYGTCSTAAATAAKVVTLATNGAWTLKVGAIIAVKFTATNTAANPTLNVNNTGAKPVYYNTAVLTDANLSYAGYASRVHIYAYDGTNYVYLGHSVDNNSTYSDMKAATADAAGTHGLAPAPAAGKQTYFLRGDATWTDVTPALIGAAASSHNHSASDINSGTLSADRLATSGATAGSYGPSANASPAHSGTFSVPYLTVDTKGRVTAISTKTITLPASGNTDSNVSQSVTTTGNYRNVILGYTNTSSASDDRTGTVTNVVYSSNKIFTRPSEGRLYGEHLYAWVNSTDDVTVNLIRSGNSSWRFRNSGGDLFLENNFYSSKTQDWFPLIQFDYNATGKFSIPPPPTATSTNRKLILSYNSIEFRGCSQANWAMDNRWSASDGTILFRNGIYGTAAGAMTYMFWGESYNSTTNAMRYYQAASGLVTSCVNGFRIVQDGYGAFFRNYGSNLYIMSTGKKTDGSEWTATYNSLRPVTINLATGLVTIGNGLTVTGTLTGTLTGNSSTATALATARSINGVSFDGSADITVPRSSIHVHTAQGSNGSTGWVKICDIKITGTYANHPLFFRIAQRGKPQFILTLLFENKDSTNINVASFRTESVSKVDFGGTATIVKASDNVTWGLYIQKTEAYDHIYVLDFSKANGDEGNKYTVTWTNVLSASKPTGGVDAQNKLSALKEETMLVTKGSTDYYGMMTPGEATNQWIRTTSLGLIPSESGAAGSGHCKLGTSTWYFSEAYIDTVYGTITNANNCNTTVTDPSTNTYTSYGIVFTIHPDTSEYNGMKKTNDFRLKHFRGAANTEGMTELVLGNSTAKTAANNSSGQISLYNENGKFTTFKPGTNSTDNLSIRLPDTAGTMTNIIYKTAKTASAVSNAGWTNVTTDSNIVPTMSFIAYWNGRYNSSSSNLQYCDRGRFGTIVTKASDDYLAITGGTLTGNVTAPTFIGELTGNASTATKLKTARTLNTISFDGSANKIIPVQFCYHYDDSSDATTVSWHKVASTSITSTTSDRQITFYVVNNYSDTRTGGILKAYVRSGSTAGSYNKANLIWELKSSDAGMALANFVLVYTTNTTDGVFSAEIWCKISKRYESLKFIVLSMSDRTGKGNPNDAWTLYNTTDGSSTYTSGTKAITSTLGLSTVPNTISRALYDTDGSDWTNTIGIGWASSPLTADEADEVACFTNKATVQGSPTHHIKNLQFSEFKKKIEVVSDILFSGGTTSSTANIGYSVTDYQRLKIYATVNSMEVVVEIPALVGITRTIHAGTPSPASQTNNIFYGVLWQISDKTVSCAGGKTSTLTSSASLSSNGVATVIKKIVGYKY